MMKRHVDDSGQGMTELALLLPVFVLLVMGALFLLDLVHARLRAHETARYAAFASAHTALRNYAEDAPIVLPIVGVVGGRMSTALGAVADAARLQAARSSRIGKPFFGALGSESVNVAPARFNYMPTASVSEILDKAGDPKAAEVVGIVGDIISWVFAGGLYLFGFNGFSVVSATVSTPLNMNTMPWAFLGFKSGEELRGVTITENVTLIADSWALADGRDVWPGGYVGAPSDHPTTKISGMQIQVDRIHLLKGVVEHTLGTQLKGLGEGIAQAVSKVIGVDKLGTITATRVSMKNYGLTDTNTGAASGTGKTDIFQAIGLEPLDQSEFRSFDSTQMSDDADHPDDSRQIRGFKNRGPYFMGCPHSQDLACSSVK